MKKEPVIKLIWHGHETIEAIKKLLSDVKEIEVELPFDYNHALFHALSPDASNAVMEELDISGGPELLSKIANVSGLEEMEELIEVLEIAKATVQIISPPMLIITFP